MSGLAIFRPSGALLHVEVQRFDEPRKGSELWATMPRPLLGARAAPARRKGKKSSWGTLDDIIGEWPGDEFLHLHPDLVRVEHCRPDDLPKGP